MLRAPTACLGRSISAPEFAAKRSAAGACFHADAAPLRGPARSRETHPEPKYVVVHPRSLDDSHLHEALSLIKTAHGVTCAPGNATNTYCAGVSPTLPLAVLTGGGALSRAKRKRCPDNNSSTCCAARRTSPPAAAAAATPRCAPAATCAPASSTSSAPVARTTARRTFCSTLRRPGRCCRT